MFLATLRSMSWRHIAGLIAALALPVICGLSPNCSATSLKDIISLSMVVAAGIVGNANASGTATATATSKGATAKEEVKD